MNFLAVLLCLANAYLLARYAKDKFATILALSLLISSISGAIYYSISMATTSLLSSGYFWGLTIGFAVLIFLLANPLRYFFAWLIAFSVICLAILIPFQIQLSSSVAGITAIAALVPVILLRREIKLVLIGIMSGANIAMALSIIFVAMGLFTSGESMAYITAILFLGLSALGIYFQFKLYDKYFSKSV